MADVLPDCMMPDGADPCAGYRRLMDDHRVALAAARLQGWREGREAAAKWYFDQATQLDSDTEWVCSAIRALPEPDYSEEE
jgi:hypothetical protein